jgi:hypothetical protein
MADEDDYPAGETEECREPTLKDLEEVCLHLNAQGARYVVVGGFAIRAAGLLRRTMDIDLLIETGVENETKVKAALMNLPDQAVEDLRPGEVAEQIVVRVADEIMVDLMKSGCTVDYAEAISDAESMLVGKALIPFASPQTLWKMKQTVRERDIPDRLFLRQKLAEMGTPVPEAPTRMFLPRWLEHVRQWLVRRLGGRP